MNKQAVLLLDFGGPKNLDAVKPFLLELFSDRAVIPLPFGRNFVARLITASRLSKVKAQYASIGGGSPLIAQTKKIAGALEKRFAATQLNFPVYTAMRYTEPSIRETLWQMVKDNIHEVVVLPMFPQFSFATTGSVFSELQKIAKSLAPYLTLTLVRQWSEEPEFILAWVQVIQEAIQKCADASNDKEPIHLLFSAHSLPVKLVTMKNDPYPKQIEQCIAKILQESGLKNPWHLSFQSKIGPVKWLGPSTMDKVKELGAQGVKKLVFIPISFLTDHIETLYEIDLLLIPEAQEAGVTTCVRTRALIQNPHLVSALEKIILSRLFPR